MVATLDRLAPQIESMLNGRRIGAIGRRALACASCAAC
jgi:hypothetical protein